MMGELLNRSLRLRRGEHEMAAYEADHGAFTDDELAAANRTLDAAGVGVRTSVERARD